MSYKNFTNLILAISIALWVLAGYYIWKPLKVCGQEEYPILIIYNGNTLRAISNPVYLKTYVLGVRIVTGYSSSPDETDDTPFITASGERVRQGIVATNELPFGTLIKIDGKTYEVLDRMAKKHPNRFDVWFSSKEEALNWGKKELLVEVVVGKPKI